MAGIALSQTNELVEQVLLHLPMEEILLARAVSRHWKTLIENSLPLKRATFIAAAGDRFLTLDRVFEPWPWPDRRPPLSLKFDEEEGLIMNPLIQHSHYVKIPPYYCDHGFCGTNLPERHLRHYRIWFPPVNVLATMGSSTVRKMSITWPPCTVLWLFVETTSKVLNEAILYDRRGITLSLVFEFFSKMLESCEDVRPIHVELRAEFSREDLEWERAERRLEREAIYGPLPW